MSTELKAIAKELFAKGGNAGEIWFSDGRRFAFSRKENILQSTDSNTSVSLDTPPNVLSNSLANDEIKELLQIFQGRPHLEALLLQNIDNNTKTIEIRITRDLTALVPSVRFGVFTSKANGSQEKEQNFQKSFPIGSSSKPGRILSSDELIEALRDPTRVLYAREYQGRTVLSDQMPAPSELKGIIPAVSLEDLGTQSFRKAHNVRYAYLSGAMAGGIGSAALVIAMGKAGFMGFFGAGGVPLPKVEEAILEVKQALDQGEPFGFNLLHNPFEPRIEDATAALYVKHEIPCIDASAYMNLTPAIVYYRAKGLKQLPDGSIFAPRHVFAKVSRTEVAERFLSPAPESILRELVSLQKISEEEARLASKLPVAEDVTAEADSGGHTDRRPLSVLFPLLLQLRDELTEKFSYQKQGISIRVGAAGGIAEPIAAQAAFSLGADFVMTGSLNQASLEAGTSPLVKNMLLSADMADVTMAPAPDMFEMGVQVQVLKRGTLYAPRAQKLYEIYKKYSSFEELPDSEKTKVEKQIFRNSFSEVWRGTEAYWQERDPEEAEKARQDPKHRMALCFRWYLGMASRWARIGESARKLDFQIWCGPAMGAFNRWSKGTWLEKLENRRAPLMGAAILQGVVALRRLESAKYAGVNPLPSKSILSRPPLREDLLCKGC